MTEILDGYCQCGCGTQLAPLRHRSRGGRVGQFPRFAMGHGCRLPGWPFDVVPAPAGLDPALGDCWIWKRGLTVAGYGKVSVNGRSVHAHRRIYEQQVGPIPAERVPDHLCRRRACVNYAHLEPVTVAVNTQRGSNATLTPEQVVEIFVAPRSRAILGRLAAKYGVCRATVLFIRTGKTWRNITSGLERQARPVRHCSSCAAELSPMTRRRTCSDACRTERLTAGARLNFQQASSIRRALESGTDRGSLASSYGVSRPLIDMIASGKVWRIPATPPGAADAAVAA